MATAASQEEKKEDSTPRRLEKSIGDWDVIVPSPCVCGEEFEFGGWHAIKIGDGDKPHKRRGILGTLAGSTHCAHCGTKWRIHPGVEIDWEDLPILKMDEAYIQATQEFYLETGLSKRENEGIWENFLNNHYPDLV